MSDTRGTKRRNSVLGDQEVSAAKRPRVASNKKSKSTKAVEPVGPETKAEVKVSLAPSVPLGLDRSLDTLSMRLSRVPKKQPSPDQRKTQRDRITEQLLRHEYYLSDGDGDRVSEFNTALDAWILGVTDKKRVPLILVWLEHHLAMSTAYRANRGRNIDIGCVAPGPNRVMRHLERLYSFLEHRGLHRLKCCDCCGNFDNDHLDIAYASEMPWDRWNRRKNWPQDADWSKRTRDLPGDDCFPPLDLTEMRLVANLTSEQRQRRLDALISDESAATSESETPEIKIERKAEPEGDYEWRFTNVDKLIGNVKGGGRSLSAIGGHYPDMRDVLRNEFLPESDAKTKSSLQVKLAQQLAEPVNVCDRCAPASMTVGRALRGRVELAKGTTALSVLSQARQMHAPLPSA